MDRDDQTARELELNRNEVKWQESVKRTADALRKARQEGRNECGVTIVLDRTMEHVSNVYWTEGGWHRPALAVYHTRDWYAGEPVPQGDGDCR